MWILNFVWMFYKDMIMDVNVDIVKCYFVEVLDGYRFENMVDFFYFDVVMYWLGIDIVGFERI